MLAVVVTVLGATAAFAQANLAALATYLGPDREQRLIDGAKREGELMVYSSMQNESIAPLQKAFQDKYGLKIKIWRGAGKDILRRVTVEAKANRFDLDIVESDGFALEALHREGLLQAVRSPRRWSRLARPRRPARATSRRSPLISGPTASSGWSRAPARKAS